MARKTPDPESWIDLDLTAAARAGKLAPAWDVDRWLQPVESLLCTEGGRAPVLVGPPGVGKTAVVRALVHRVLAGEVAPALRELRVVEVRLGSIAARFKEPADHTEEVYTFFDRLAAMPVLVLLRDLIVANRLDWEPVLIRYLDRSPRPFVAESSPAGLATLTQFHQEMGERLVPIPVDEPDPARTTELLRRWATTQAVGVTEGAIQVTMDLTSRYLGHQFFPRKAIELLRQATDLCPPGGAVSEADVVTRFHAATRVPRALIDPDEPMPIAPLRQELGRELIGQTDAVDTVTRAVARMKAGLADPRRPFGVFLFVGPSGVGKTRCAQLLAEHVFGDERRIVRVNLGEYAGANDHLLLFGNPHNNNADQRRGRLSAALTGTPVGVLLLDELEKGNKNVQDALFPVLDEGRFVNGAGEMVSVRSFIVIATSNAGAEAWRERSSGFARAADLDEEAMRRMRAQFRPEFLNRFDRIIPFQPLDGAALERIAEHQLQALARRDGLRRRGVEVRWTAAVRAWLASHAGDPVFGARPLRHAVEHDVASAVAELLVSGDEPAREILLDLDRGRIVARFAGVRAAA